MLSEVLSLFFLIYCIYFLLILLIMLIYFFWYLRACPSPDELNCCFSIPVCSYLCRSSELLFWKILSHRSQAYRPPTVFLFFFISGKSSSFWSSDTPSEAVSATFRGTERRSRTISPWKACTESNVCVYLLCLPDSCWVSLSPLCLSKTGQVFWRWGWWCRCRWAGGWGWFVCYRILPCRCTEHHLALLWQPVLAMMPSKC